MSTALDLDLVPAVKELIDALGGTATLARESHSYDPATGEDASEVPATTYTVKATPPAPDRKNYPSTTVEARRNLTTLLAASGLAITPSVGDRLSFAAGTFVVIAVVRIQSGDDVCAWQLEVEAG